jgi:hypothetical protein
MKDPRTCSSCGAVFTPDDARRRYCDSCSTSASGASEPFDFAPGRTQREAAVWLDLKQTIREAAIAEVRDELHAYFGDLDSIEGVIETVDDFLADVLAPRPLDDYSDPE